MLARSLANISDGVNAGGGIITVSVVLIGMTGLPSLFSEFCTNKMKLLPSTYRQLHDFCEIKIGSLLFEVLGIC